MRKFFAILIGRLAGKLSKSTGRGSGSTIPGVVAQKIDPNIISKLSGKLPGGIVLITGTNGKTTTAKMLATILEEAGVKVIYNFAGSNLSRGIASLLISHTNFWGTKIDAQMAIFEVDEATMPEITAHVTPKVVLVTNLFRDQLDRYGELDRTASIIGESIKLLDGTAIFLNSDDPLVSSLSNYNRKVAYFGLNLDNFETNSTGAIDSKDCVYCGAPLTFQKRYFGHLGQYECKKCGKKRPEPNYLLEKIDLNVENSSATLVTPVGNTNINLQIPGLYNLYNAIAAASVANYLNIPLNKIAYSLNNVSAAFGRMEKICFAGNKCIYLLLVKNPTGFTQCIETLCYDKSPKKLLLALNDNFADGTDVSWIWDAELELLTETADQVIVSGIRAEDMQLRLKYADFNLENVTIEKNIPSALDKGVASLSESETLYILPTYTAMLEIRKILAKMGMVKGRLE